MIRDAVALLRKTSLLVRAITKRDSHIALLVQNGRLGNQLFQLAFAKSVCDECIFVLFGMRDIASLVGDDAILFNTKRGIVGVSIRWICLHWDLIFACISKLRFVNTYQELIVNERASVKKIKGICSRVSLFSGYFQYPDMFVDNINTVVRREWYERAVLKGEQRLSDTVGREVKLDNIYFCHIRRGDYCSYPVGSPAVLPLEWVIKCIRLIECHDSKAVFIILTDDRQYVLDCIGLLPGTCHISEGGEIEDFSLMMACAGGGILSASSFSLSAALMSVCATRRYFAPKGWIAWRSKGWLPHRDIASENIDYIDVC